MTSKIPRKAKLNAENFAIYESASFGRCIVYERNVIRLARDAIRVPVPPILTPRRSSR